MCGNSRAVGNSHLWIHNLCASAFGERMCDCVVLLYLKSCKIGRERVPRAVVRSNEVTFENILFIRAKRFTSLEHFIKGYLTLFQM